MAKKKPGKRMFIDQSPGAVLLEIDGKFHQVALSKTQFESVVSLCVLLHGGELRCLEDPIEGLCMSVPGTN